MQKEYVLTFCGRRRIKACDHFMSEGGKSQEARSVISKLVNLVLT